MNGNTRDLKSLNDKLTNTNKNTERVVELLSQTPTAYLSPDSSPLREEGFTTPPRRP